MRLRVGEQTFHFDASDVPNDPVEELAALLDQLAKGGAGGLVWWHSEPAGYYLEITKSDSGFQLTLSFETQNHESKRCIQAQAVGSATDILLPLWRGLKQFCSHQSLPSHWHSVSATSSSPVDLKALKKAILTLPKALMAFVPEKCMT